MFYNLYGDLLYFLRDFRVKGGFCRIEFLVWNYRVWVILGVFEGVLCFLGYLSFYSLVFKVDFIEGG